jgi:hypothetical protein
VLGIIPLALLGVPLLLGELGWALTVAVPVGGAASAALIGHALFVNGPTDPVAGPAASAEANGRQLHPSAD